ncbi:hypothetical protein JCM15765_16680 [Paradesulfitobacterium aromaticivorans]
MSNRTGKSISLKKPSYLHDLESYSIFEKEWKNIKRTNNVEGGVGEFFAQAKTSRQLLETILIPAVEEAIFNGEEDAKRLAQAFQKVNQNLIRLPELEKNLQDFQLLRTEGERVLTAVRTFAASQTKLLGEKSRLRKLFNRVENEFEIVTQDLTQIEEALAAKKTERHRLLYHSESIPYVSLTRDKASAEKEQQEAQEKLGSLRERQTEAEFTFRHSQGVNLYLERAELSATNLGYEKSRELIINLQKEKDSAEQATAELKESLGRFSIRCVDPHVEQNRIEAEISAKKMDIRDRIRLEGVRLEEFKSQLNLIRETDSYVPNREILKVQKLLQELQIPSQTGSKWLEEQGDEQERESYLRHQPLLPFALVLAEEDFKRLQNSKALQTELLSCPVPLIVRRPELVPSGETKPEKILSIGGPAYLLWHKGYSYALSAQSLVEVAQALETEIGRKTETLQNLQVTEEQIIKLDELDRAYYRHYPSGYLSGLTAQIDKANEELTAAKSARTVLIAEKARVERENEDTMRLAEESKSEENLRERDLDRFKAWQKDFLDRAEKYAERKVALDEQQKIADRLEQGEAEQEQTREEYVNGERKLKDVEVLRKKRHEELNSVPAPSQKVIPQHEAGYEEAKALWEANENEFAQAHLELKHWEENIKRNLDEIQKLEKRITRDLKLELAEVEDAKYQVPDEEIERQERELRKLKEDVDGWQKRVNAAGLAIERIMGQLIQIEKHIKNTYGQPPAEIFNDLEAEATKIKREIEALKVQVEEWNQILSDTVNRKTTLSGALNSLATSIKNFDVPPGGEQLEADEWESVRTKLLITIETWAKELQVSQKDVQKLREAVEKSFRHYAQILREQGNTVIDRFVSHLVADEERHLQLEAVEQSFAKSFEIIAQYEEKVTFELKEAERNKQELVERSLKQVERIAQEMQMIDRYVKVDYAGGG